MELDFDKMNGLVPAIIQDNETRKVLMLGFMNIGKKKEDALKLGDTFIKMIKGEATEDEIEGLEEASALRDISHMPARVKCAVLGWHTLSEALNGKEKK